MRFLIAARGFGVMACWDNGLDIPSPHFPVTPPTHAWRADVTNQDSIVRLPRHFATGQLCFSGRCDIVVAMKACIQRVSRAQVTVGGQITGQIGPGMLILLGVAHDDDEARARMLAEKIVALRIFEDAEEKMNLALADVGGAALVVSQFTLLGDCRKGRRPSFTAAAPPEQAERLYQVFVESVAARGIPVATGQFRQHMEVELVNDGPVTLLLDTRDWERSRRSNPDC